MVSCLGSLVQPCCGEGGALQANVPGVCGEHWQVFQPHRVCPRSPRVCFPVYTAQAPGCSPGSVPALCALPSPSRSGSVSQVPHKDAGSVGPAFCAVSGPSSSGNWVLEEHTLFRCSTTSPLPVPASVSRRAQSSPLVSVLGS